MPERLARRRWRAITGELPRAAVRWPSFLGAIAALVTCALALLAGPAPAASASGGGSAGQDTRAQLAALALPEGAAFVGRPQISANIPGVKQACGTPTRPGQMACMALIGGHRQYFGPDAGAPPGPSYDPAELQNAYGLTAAAQAPAHGETVAIVDSYNDPRASTDLAEYRSAYGLPPCDVGNKCLSVENQYGGKQNLPRADGSGGWELEESLDLDMVSAICPYCSIILVEANSNSISDLATAERTASRRAEAVSNSWGSGAEFIGETAYDHDFYAPGVAITAAGGDNGYGTQYPAVSPFVTAVGGTTLTGGTGSWTQSAWNGTGSGCSELEPKPSWQTVDDRAPGGCLNRTDDDLAADADPNPGVFVYDTVRNASGATGWITAGGTSVGTAIVAAAYALADVAAGGAHKALVPFTFPASYPYQNRSRFSDVTSGSDGYCEPGRRYLCQAVPGYDGPTGVGTPNGVQGLTGPRSGEVTIVNPGTRVYRAATKIDLRLSALSGGGTLTFSATGLPGTISLGRDGVLRGFAPRSAGLHLVKVIATAKGLRPGTVRFAVVVVAKISSTHLVPGQVRLSGSRSCLTGADGSSTAGTPVQIAPCTGLAAQDWIFVPGGSPDGAGAMKIQGNCLTIKTGVGNGAAASIQSCDNSARQQWKYQGSGHLRNVATGDCLAVRGDLARGRRVVNWMCGGSAADGWLLPAAPVLSGLSGRCLADPRNDAAAGISVEASRCRAAKSQRWTAEPDGMITINGMCLAVRDSILLDGAGIELARCSDSAAQHWARGPDGQLVNQNSGRCLADPADSGKSGALLIQDDCYSLPGEIWVIS